MEHNPEKGARALSCEAWEAMLADALDGTLDAGDAAAFDAHARDCGAGCAELLEEAKRGSEWLRFLRETPSAPEGLLEKILAGTTGLPAAEQPLAAAGAVALPQQPWLGVPLGLLQKHMAESRILMTLAMAFFSLALTLNLTGVRLNQVKLSDLRPSTLASSVSKEYFNTYKQVAHYYFSLRIVYELESRVNEMRHDSPTPTPLPTPQQQPQKPQTQNSGKPGGSARKSGGGAAEQGRRSYEAPMPVLALFSHHERAGAMEAGSPARLNATPARVFSFIPVLSNRTSLSKPGNHHKAFFLLPRAAEFHSAWPFLRPHELLLDGQHRQEKMLTPSERSLV